MGGRRAEAATVADILVVGGGLAAATAIETMLTSGVEGRRILLLSAEPELPYHRPPLSKGYVLGRVTRESLFVRPQRFYENAGVAVRLGVLVSRVDTERRSVTTKAGEKVEYEKLLLATGCTARTLDVPGNTLPNIFTLRTLACADRLKSALRTAKTAVIVGGSFIGMELAAACAQSGIRTTLLHRGKEIFEKLGSTEASAFFSQTFAERGVTIRTEDEALAFEPTPRSSAVTVQTRRGDTLRADMVAVGVGVVPETSYLAGSGVRVENGIIANEYLETSVPGVYAAGDVANFFDPLYGRQRRIEHWDTAIQHGRVAGKNMAAARPEDRIPYDSVSYFFSDVFDTSFEYFGDAAGGTRTVTRGSFDDRSVTVFFLEDRAVRAAFTMGRPRERQALMRLLRNQRTTFLKDPERLADPSSPLPASVV